jgi:phosphoglycolate phosphatase/pyrophosphatase PpaX
MMKYSYLVLDHDDTVVKSTVQLHYPAYLHTMAILRPDVIPLTCVAFQEACAHPGLTELYEQTYSYTKEEMAFELEDWRNFVKEKIPDAFEGLGEVLTAYCKAGGKIAVVSHSDEKLIVRDYEHHFGFAPHVIYDLSYPNNKPAPDPLLDLMQRFDLTADQLLVVDDLPTGLTMATAAGVDFAYAGWCENAPSIDRTMKEKSPAVFSTVADLAGKIL